MCIVNWFSNTIDQITIVIYRQTFFLSFFEFSWWINFVIKYRITGTCINLNNFMAWIYTFCDHYLIKWINGSKGYRTRNITLVFDKIAPW